MAAPSRVLSDSRARAAQRSSGPSKRLWSPEAQVDYSRWADERSTAMGRTSFRFGAFTARRSSCAFQPLSGASCSATQTRHHGPQIEGPAAQRQHRRKQ